MTKPYLKVIIIIKMKHDRKSTRHNPTNTKQLYCDTVTQFVKVTK